MDDYDWVRSLEYFIETWGYEEPDNYFMEKRYVFQAKSLNSWAAREVIEEIKRYPGADPINVVIDFNERMQRLCSRARTNRSRLQLSTLCHVSRNMIDYLESLLN